MWVNAVMLSLLVIAAAIDLRRREVPHWIPISLLALAILSVGFQLVELTWIDLLGGLAIGFVVPFILYLIGGIEAGDVKLLAALGALVGPWAMISVLIWIGLAGGVLALVSLLRGRREYAYVPAITMGFLMHFVATEGFGYAIIS